MIDDHGTDAPRFCKAYSFERVPIESRVDGDIIDILFQQVFHLTSVRFVVAGYRIPATEDVVARQPKYLNLFVYRFEILKIVYIRCDDYDSMALFGQFECQVFSVFLYPPYMGKVMS